MKLASSFSILSRGYLVLCSGIDEAGIGLLPNWLSFQHIAAYDGTGSQLIVGQAAVFLG